MVEGPWTRAGAIAAIGLLALASLTFALTYVGQIPTLVVPYAKFGAVAALTVGVAVAFFVWGLPRLRGWRRGREHVPNEQTQKLILLYDRADKIWSPAMNYVYSFTQVGLEITNELMSQSATTSVRGASNAGDLRDWIGQTGGAYYSWKNAVSNKGSVPAIFRWIVRGGSLDDRETFLFATELLLDFVLSGHAVANLFGQSARNAAAVGLARTPYVRERWDEFARKANTLSDEVTTFCEAQKLAYGLDLAAYIPPVRKL